MKKIIFVVIMLVVGKCFGQWQTVLDSSNYRFSNVYFINNDTGFVCGERIGQPYSAIARTMDGGQTWDFSSEHIFFMSIQFVNDSVGFAGGQDGFIYSTTNMGTTWNYAGDVFSVSDQSAFYFINSQVGYSTSFYGGISRTTDSGVTWNYAFNSVGKSYFPGTAKFFFVDSSIGFVAQSTQGQQQGLNGKAISKTMDGGATWADLPIPADFYPYSCFFFDSLSGFSVGYHGKVTKTNDGGLTWTTPDSICPYPLYDIVFVNDSIGYITGGLNVYNFFGSTNGIIFKTIDRGNSWFIMDSTYSDGLTKMHFPTPSVGYAVGMGGIVLKITDANYPNSSVQNLSTINETISLFPNPTSGKFTIESATGKTENIKITNLLGEIVFQFEIHNSKSEINLSDVPKGIYFVRIENETQNVINRKIIVQ